MQADVDFGVFLAQLGHRHRQHVTGLGVGGGNGQGAAVLRTVLLTNFLEVAHFAQDQLDAAQHMLSGFGDSFEAFAMARKDFDAQLLLQLNDGFGHARLRRVQYLGCFGQVQIAPSGFLDKSKLMKVHMLAVILTSSIMLYVSM